MMKNTNKTYSIGVPMNLKEMVEETISKALQTFRQVVQYENEINIVVFEAQPEFVIPEIGLMGKAVGKQGIEVYVDFSREFTNDELEQELAATVYHEATHLAREHFIGFDKTLLGAMVSEGVSCYVEQHFVTDRTIPYIEPIDNEVNYLKGVRPLFNSIDYDYGKWFFGAPDFPKWVGYRLGYVITKSFMEKTDASIDQLVRTQTQVIFAKSKV